MIPIKRVFFFLVAIIIMFFQHRTHAELGGFIWLAVTFLAVYGLEGLLFGLQ